MASIALRLDSRSQKNGMCPVRLRISHQHLAAWVPTGVAVEPQFFKNDSIYDPIAPKAYMAKEKREQLAVLVRKWDEGIFDLLRAEGGETQLAQMTAQDLRKYIFGERRRATAKEVISKRKNITAPDFLDWFQQYGEQRNSPNTRNHFAYVWRLLYNYMKERGMQHLTFRDIDYAFLVDLRAWNRASRGEATRFKTESYIRAAYREGMRRGMISREHDPFFDFRIEKVPQGDIETVSIDTIRRLRSMNLSGRFEMERARNLLFISYYLCGANFQDVYHMPAPKDGEVAFVRSKVSNHTQQKVRIRIEPELEALLKKYADPTGERMLQLNSRFEILRHNVWRAFDKLSKELGERVNFASFRRTWSTVAGRLKCPEVVIDKSMGHIVNTVNARYYEDYDWSRTANWNRKIIDYTLYQNLRI